MSARDDVPGADWTSATGFPLLRNLSRGPAAQKPAPGLLARLLARLRPTLPPAPDLAAGDLARPAAVRCASCGTRYFPRPSGASGHTDRHPEARPMTRPVVVHVVTCRGAQLAAAWAALAAANARPN